MSVRCPKCGTQHKLSAAIPPEGLLARCTKCAAVFRIEAPQASGYSGTQQQHSDAAIPAAPAPAESPPEPEPPASASTPPSEEVTTDNGESEPAEQVTVSGPDDPPSSTGSLPVASRSNTVVEQHTVDPNSAKDVLEMVLRGEQERREMMYHVTREISRLREAVEQQHELLAEVTEQVSDYGKRLAGAFTAPPFSGTDVPSQGLSQDDFDGQLRELEEALTREREVVERLRKSKLDLERRTADAEAQLEDLRNRSLIERLLGRHDD